MDSNSRNSSKKYHSIDVPRSEQDLPHSIKIPTQETLGVEHSQKSAPPKSPRDQATDLFGSVMQPKEKKSATKVTELPAYENLAELSSKVTQTRKMLRGENCTFNLEASSLFCLGPDWSTRRKMFNVVDHRNFERAVLLMIFLNCVTLILATPVIVDQPGVSTAVFVGEIVFQTLFTLEMMAKVYALGFVLHEHSYLRSGWNQMDFIIVVLGFVGFFVENGFSAIRLARVLKPLKAVSKVPELSALISALMSSVPRMRDVFLLMFFELLIFSILGLQLYVGTQHQRCYTTQNVSYTVFDISLGANVTLYREQPLLVPFDESWCSTSSTFGHQCPVNTTCAVHLDVYSQPVLNFDNLGNSLLYIFKIVSMDNWPSDLWRLQAVGGTWNFIFAFVVVLFGSFFCVNLILAILSSEYNTASEDAEKVAEEARRQDLIDGVDLDDDEFEDEIVVEGVDDTGETQIRVISPEESMNLESSANYESPSYNPGGESTSSPGTGTIRRGSSHSLGGSVMMSGSFRRSSQMLGNSSMLGVSVRRRRKQKEESSLEKFRNSMKKFVEHKFFERFMFAVTILNVLVLAVDHHPIDTTLEVVLNWINFGCSIIFILEFFCKVIALGLKYFHDAFNCFDALLVAVSIPEMAVSGAGSGSAFSALRAFRLLRVFRVIKASKTIRRLLVTVFKAAASAGYLFLLLVLFILVLALVGINLMEKAYAPGVRPNFSNLGDALLLVFIVITGENWMEVTEIGMQGSHPAMVIYFLLLFCFGNWIVLNLFVAILIDSFSSHESEDEEGAKEEKETLVEKFAVNAFKTASTSQLQSEKPIPLQTSRKQKEKELLSIDSGSGMGQEVEEALGLSVPTEQNRSPTPSVDSGTSPSPKDLFRPKPILMDAEEPELGKLGKATSSQTLLSRQESQSWGVLDLTPKTRQKQTFGSVLGSVFGKRKKLVREEDQEMSAKETAIPPTSPASKEITPPSDEDPVQLEGKSFMIFGSTNCFRIACAHVVTNPFFELFIIVMIAASCIMLGFDNPTSRENPTTKTALFVTDIIFLVIFFFEALAHCIAWGVLLGKDAYLSNPWNRLDAIVVIASLVGVFFPLAGMLRALRSFKLAARVESLRLVIGATFTALPNIANVVVLLLFGFIVFGILGVQLFKGSFVYCSDSDVLLRADCNGEYNVSTVVDSYIDTQDGSIVEIVSNVTHTREWLYPYFHFNHLGSALLTLFALSLSDGWSVVLWQAIDSNSYNEAMTPYARPYMGLYVLVFVIFGCFFMMNLFIGSLIESFSTERAKKEGRVDDAGVSLLSSDQSEWLRAYRFARSATISPLVQPPGNPVRALCCRFYFADKERKEPDTKFEYFITVLIILNTLLMCLQHYGQPEEMTEVLWVLNLAFACIYTLEALIKMIALLPDAYFRDGWNRFDFFLIPLAYIAAFVGGPGTNALRVLRVARVLRLIKRAEGLKRLFDSLLFAIPQLMNISILLLLTIFIFGVVGVDLFSKVKLSPEEDESTLNEFFNFKNAGYAMITLFQISTTESWWDVMRSCMLFESNSSCSDADENCGTYGAIPYFILFMLAANCVCINLFIFVIVDNYMEVQSLAGTKAATVMMTIEHFRDEWVSIDTAATHVIHWEVMLGILHRLPSEAGFRSKSEFGFMKHLRVMNIPIDHNSQVEYVDCIRGITRHFYNLNEEQTLSVVKMISPDEAHADQASFKVQHALAARMILSNWRAKVKERQLARSVHQKLSALVTKNKSKSLLSQGSPTSELRTRASQSSLGSGSAKEKAQPSPRSSTNNGGISSPGLSLQFQESSGNFMMNGAEKEPWEGSNGGGGSTNILPITGHHQYPKIPSPEKSITPRSSPTSGHLPGTINEEDHTLRRESSPPVQQTSTLPGVEASEPAFATD